MISIVICSAKQDVLHDVLANIETTIGLTYEVIVIENGAGQFGLSQAYNSGAAKARFDILCFMHEDVSFETMNWGQKVFDYLQDTSIGLLGVAGGDTKGLVPSSWSSCVFQSEISLVQHFKHDSKPSERISKTGYSEDKSTIKPVVCMDGVWLCTRKDVFAHCKFDSDTFGGFHGYDVDFSLQVSARYKTYVVFDIVLHHYSEGKYDKTWMQNMMLLSKKWKHQLPVSVRDLSQKELVIQHWTVMSRFIDNLIKLGYKLPAVGYYLCKYSCNRFFRVRYFLYSIKYTLQTYYKPKNKMYEFNQPGF